MMTMDYKLILLALIGSFMGIFISLYVRYYTNCILRGIKKSVGLLLGFMIFVVLLTAVVISGYVFQSELFESYTTKLGRVAFTLLWIVPFLITGISCLVRLLKAGKE